MNVFVCMPELRLKKARINSADGLEHKFENKKAAASLRVYTE